MSHGITPETLKLIAKQVESERLQQSRQHFESLMELVYEKLAAAAKSGLYRYTLERQLHGIESYYSLDEPLFSRVVAALVANGFTVNMLDKCKYVIIWE